MKSFEKYRASVIRRSKVKRIIIILFLVCMLALSDREAVRFSSSAYLSIDLQKDACGGVCASVESGSQKYDFRFSADIAANVYRSAFRFWKDVLPFPKKKL